MDSSVEEGMAIPFIEVNDRGEFTVTTEAMGFLEE